MEGRLFVFASVVWVAGCWSTGRAPRGDADSDSDSDTDTDVDSDSDTDTGSDSDTATDTGTDTDTGTGSDTDPCLDPDADGDGYDSEACGGDDCDDDDASVHPGDVDPIGEGVDNNCDGVDGIDADGDGWNRVDDCDDADPARHPEAEDVVGDAVDQNCDDLDGVDADGDAAASEGSGGGDCDDDDEGVHPGAIDVPGDGVDRDCDGTDGTDRDGDGYHAPSAGGDDCNDDEALVHPGGEESCNGLDDDCDGVADAALDCGWRSCQEILDENAGAKSGVFEIRPEPGVLVDVLCDMDLDDGWTLALLKNSSEASSMVDFGVGYVGTASLVVDPVDASDTDDSHTGWLDLNHFSYDTLRFSAAFEGEARFDSEEIAQSDLRIAFGQDGYYLYDDARGYYWCGGVRAFTDDGIGQVNRPAGAPADCKGHGGLGSGWDFSDGLGTNAGLTVCGHEGGWMHGDWNDYAGSSRNYPTSGAAQAIWVKGTRDVTFYRDADGDGHGDAADSVDAPEAPDGYVGSSDDCDDASAAAHPGAVEECNGADDDCDGRVDEGCGADPLSCAEHLAADAGALDGVYEIDTAVGLVSVWCDMTTDGGGWTLAFVANSAAAPDVLDFGLGYVDTDVLAFSAGETAASGTARSGWIDLNDLPFDTMRVASYRDAALEWSSADIARADLRIAFGEDGYYLYDDPNGYYWCGGSTTFTDDGIGQVNQPVGAPADCKTHAGLGSGWDFSDSMTGNRGLTLCGDDAGFGWLNATWDADAEFLYGGGGGALAIWVR